jgi:hypothetical protein
MAKLKSLPLDRAIDAMHHRDGRLANMNTTMGKRWFVMSPIISGPVTDETAAKIIARSDVRGNKDSLWPGLDQSLRLVR